ncbi:hypothetical protein PQR07_36815 [Paraburkholderia aspalathi]
MVITDVMNSEWGQEPATIAEAYRLADTGRYHDYTDIEHVLRFGYGLPDVRALLERPFTRQAINWRCAAARKKRDMAPAPEDR